MQISLRFMQYISAFPTASAVGEATVKMGPVSLITIYSDRGAAPIKLKQAGQWVRNKFICDFLPFFLSSGVAIKPHIMCDHVTCSPEMVGWKQVEAFSRGDIPEKETRLGGSGHSGFNHWPGRRVNQRERKMKGRAARDRGGRHWLTIECAKDV